MNNLHKKSTTQMGGTSSGLTEKRVREIARKEIIRYRHEKYLQKKEFQGKLDALTEKIINEKQKKPKVNT